jgi:hypothetical protein
MMGDVRDTFHNANPRFGAYKTDEDFRIFAFSVQAPVVDVAAAGAHIVGQVPNAKVLHDP